MKKIDLHIHTVSTISDKDFTFSLEKLSEYVSSAQIDAIAITNHDLFDLNQFSQISKALNCKVFPGIEINLDKGHVLIIDDDTNSTDFKEKSDVVAAKITKIGDSISVKELEEIFGDLKKYLVIPHHEKKPAIKGATFDSLKKYVDAGEVDSPKKFIRLIKDQSPLAPVIFSDARFSDNMTKFPTRQTYVDCGEITLKALKFSFKDKNKVALSRDDGNSLIQIFEDGQKLSTGLNIVIGERSSGKTVTLNQINEVCENVKYIEQFSLVQKDDENYEKQFNDDVARKRSLFAERYLREFNNVMSDVLSVDVKCNERRVEEYINSLLKSAEDFEKTDSYSNTKLFNAASYEVGNDKILIDLIGSVRQLIENIEYQSIIEKHIDLDALKALACELIKELWAKAYARKKKVLVNEIVDDVKDKLRLRTAATQVKHIDLYKHRIDQIKIDKFTEIVEFLQTERIIFEENFQGYKVIAKQRAFKSTGEVKSASGLKVAFSEAFKKYNQPFAYLVALKEKEDLTPSEFYKYFTCIDYEILNKDGCTVSGGERSEFRLLQEINDAQNFDLLMLDEPESSFDNLFLKGKVNAILKEISRTMPVVIVTHNSTVGASIGADYIIHTKKEYENNKAVFRRYSGHPSDTDLISICGQKISNFEVTLNSLEAGEIAYRARGSGYESIKD